MNNQENQPGTPMPGADIRVDNATTSSSTTGQAAAGSTGTSAGSQRKASTASGQSAAGTSTRSAQASSEQQPRAQQGSQEGSQQSGDNFLNTALESGKSALESGKSALESGKKWIEDQHVLDSVNQLPQSVKEWSNRAVSRVGNLSTTQKVVGGAILAAGLGWLALRKGKSTSASPSVYGREGKAGYARKSGSYGYQAPESSSRRPAATGSATSPSFENSTNQGSDRSERKSSGAGYGGASSSDYGSRTSESGYASGSSRSSDSSYRAKGDDYRSIE